MSEDTALKVMHNTIVISTRMSMRNMKTVAKINWQFYRMSVANMVLCRASCYLHCDA